MTMAAILNNYFLFIGGRQLGEGGNFHICVISWGQFSRGGFSEGGKFRRGGGTFIVAYFHRGQFSYVAIFFLDGGNFSGENFLGDNFLGNSFH